MKMSYDWVLFDADDTLFHWDDFAGLKRLLAHFDVEFTEQDYREYQAVNKPLWIEYQNGTIDTAQLHIKRFQAWGDKLNVAPQHLNSAFLEIMAEICVPIDGAVSLVQKLSGKAKMGIITNGFTAMQSVRLERTKLKHHFDIVVVSEEVGIAKPHPNIFDHALALMDNPARDKVLMVGDNPDSDILGAMNSGLHSCWVNRHNKPTPENIKPNYQVASLSELEVLLLK